MMIAGHVHLFCQILVHGPAGRPGTRPGSLAKQPRRAHPGEQGGREQDIVYLVAVVAQAKSAHAFFVSARPARELPGVKGVMGGDIAQIGCGQQGLQGLALGRVVEIAQYDHLVVTLAPQALVNPGHLGGLGPAFVL